MPRLSAVDRQLYRSLCHMRLLTKMVLTIQQPSFSLPVYGSLWCAIAYRNTAWWVNRPWVCLSCIPLSTTKSRFIGIPLEKKTLQINRFTIPLDTPAITCEWPMYMHRGQRVWHARQFGKPISLEAIRIAQSINSGRIYGFQESNNIQFPIMYRVSKRFWSFFTSIPPPNVLP